MEFIFTFDFFPRLCWVFFQPEVIFSGTLIGGDLENWYRRKCGVLIREADQNEKYSESTCGQVHFSENCKLKANYYHGTIIP